VRDGSIRVDYAPLYGKRVNPSMVQVFNTPLTGGKTVNVAYYMKYTNRHEKQALGLSDAQRKDPRILISSTGLLIRSPKKDRAVGALAES